MPWSRECEGWSEIYNAASREKRNFLTTVTLLCYMYVISMNLAMDHKLLYAHVGVSQFLLVSYCQTFLPSPHK